MKAYDIVVSHASSECADNCDGWCFGLPPGIDQTQWPLDPDNGFPLAHGFTIKLPPDYLCHGEDCAGISFFGPSFDINIGGVAPIEEVKAVLQEDIMEPSDPDLLFFWRTRTTQHRHLYWMKDILGCNYAAILLERAELQGRRCQPPRLAPNRFRDRLPEPAWITSGTASALYRSRWHNEFFEHLGVIPQDRHDFDLAFKLSVRERDPNAGLPPCSEDDPDQTGYVHHLIGEHEPVPGLEVLCEAETWMHLGGTMRPYINIPRISPFYMEFEQYFGGFNFAYGTMQFDLLNLKCDFLR